MEKKKSEWVWVLFFLVLILASPLIEGGQTYHTVFSVSARPFSSEP